MSGFGRNASQFMKKVHVAMAEKLQHAVGQADRWCFFVLRISQITPNVI